MIWLLLIVSSLLFNGALYAPFHCGWLSFFFLVPVVYGALTRRVHFMHGFFWGVSFFTVHWYAWYVLCAAHGHGLLRWAAVPLLTLYMALFSGIWLYLMGCVCHRYGQGRSTRIVSIIIMTTYGYCEWMQTGAWWIFGIFNGYCFFYPLLPLAGGYWLGVLAYLSAPLLLLCLISFAVNCAAVFVYRKKRYCVAALVCIAPFLYGYLPGRVHKRVLPLIAPVAAVPKQRCALDCAQELDGQLAAARAACPTAQILVTPESAYPYPLNEHSWAVQLWYNNALYEYDGFLLITSHRKKENRLYNTLYCIHSSRIIFYYDKTTLAPFTEYLPWPWYYLRACNDCFLKEKSPFLPAECPPAPCLTLPLDTGPWAFVPAICSDFFFGSPHLHQDLTLPIVCVANDSWFSCAYFRRLMALFARLKAYEWRRPIVYIAHDIQDYYPDVG